MRRAYTAALEKASHAPAMPAYLGQATVNLFDIWFGLLPGVIVVGLAGLILAEHTPVVQWLTYPLVPLLELSGLPEAAQAAPTFLVGFADMFLPAAMGADIQSELTRFVVAGICVSQLIYMSEVGILILRLPIPLGFKDMVLIFLLRTLITTPLMGHRLRGRNRNAWYYL